MQSSSESKVVWLSRMLRHIILVTAMLLLLYRTLCIVLQRLQYEQRSQQEEELEVQCGDDLYEEDTAIDGWHTSSHHKAANKKKKKKRLSKSERDKLKRRAVLSTQDHQDQDQGESKDHVLCDEGSEADQQGDDSAGHQQAEPLCEQRSQQEEELEVQYGDEQLHELTEAIQSAEAKLYDPDILVEQSHPLLYEQKHQGEGGGGSGVVYATEVEELKESNDVLNNEVKELKESNVVLTKSNVVLKGKVEVLNNDVKELKESNAVLTKSNAVLTKSNAVLTKSNVMLTGKVDVLNNDVKELKESNHIALSEVMNRLSLIEANSHLGSKTALRLLIFDIRKVMTDALGRSPLKNADGSENWHTFISNITEQELMILKLDKKHIKLLTKQTWVYNIAMHVSNEAATAIAINALPDGDDKILWADLYLRAYKKKPNV